jgi:MerR family transcriptional regulator, copper efflux regulator
MLRANAMTIGQLSRRTGVPIKVLREYEGLGFLYTLGRSESNYRLFGDEALWCVHVVQGLRSLGLTLKEIQTLTACCVEHPGESFEPCGTLLDEHLARALARVDARIADLQALRQRIVDFQAACASGSAPDRLPNQSSVSPVARLLASDPRRSVRKSAS